MNRIIYDYLAGLDEVIETLIDWYTLMICKESIKRHSIYFWANFDKEYETTPWYWCKYYFLYYPQESITNFTKWLKAKYKYIEEYNKNKC